LIILNLFYFFSSELLEKGKSIPIITLFIYQAVFSDKKGVLSCFFMNKMKFINGLKDLKRGNFESENRLECYIKNVDYCSFAMIEDVH